MWFLMRARRCARNGKPSKSCNISETMWRKAMEDKRNMNENKSRRAVHPLRHPRGRTAMSKIYMENGAVPPIRHGHDSTPGNAPAANAEVRDQRSEVSTGSAPVAGSAPVNAPAAD